MAARRVLMVCYEGVELLDVAGPVGVFSTADRLLGGRGGYRVELAASRAGPVATAGGVELVAGRALARVRGPIDTMLVGGALHSALSDAGALAAPIARLARRARRIAAVCTGAFLLGAAGLLRGRRAVTHWAACDELRRLHPECRVEADRIFVRDRRVWTSAGVTAGIDLALALVEQDHGPALALEVARWLVMYLRRPGGQSQFSAPLAGQRADHDAVSAVVGWMSENLRADLSVPALARRASMSVRNFARVFRRETGATPAAFTLRLRMEAARRELELTGRSAKQIAGASGFGTVETMHRAFRRSLGTTPLEYRSRFATRRRVA
ncbi:MAG TPA: helix-turn-helix domain-containing protein [Kofleriaceae bacterium]|nr:helix-turn-helix domain-containing protein [Kofleriaceae bacterium]